MRYCILRSTRLPNLRHNRTKLRLQPITLLILPRKQPLLMLRSTITAQQLQSEISSQTKLAKIKRLIRLPLEG